MDNKIFHSKDKYQSNYKVVEDSVFKANYKYYLIICDSGLTSCLVSYDPTNSIN